MRVRVNELLTISRLPAALWTGIHGGREFFENPGSSIMSLCVFNLGAEFVEVPPEVQEDVQLCRDFSTKRDHITVVLEFLEVTATTRATRINNLAIMEQKLLFTEFSEVLKKNQELKRLIQLFETNGMMPSRLDIGAQIYPSFVQTILELKWALDNLDVKLLEMENPPGKPA